MMWNELLVMDIKNSTHLKKSVSEKINLLPSSGGMTRLKSSKRV